jgi:hypothetical protein
MLANTDPEIATNTQHTQMQENSTQKQAETSLGQDPQHKSLAKTLQTTHCWTS